ncbi:cytochrome P450 family protein [Paenibacillus azoreducens]|uniref:cytochrome P450 family protein n=1 Tax=Paenibacillus azoreducens TaxID=116718 RepID=UPI0039F5B1AD
MEEIRGSDFASPETMRDFISFYKRLAGQQEPIYPIDDFFGMGKAWVAFRHDDVVQILKDPRFLKNMRSLAPQQNEQKSFESNDSVSQIIEWLNNMPNMLTVDPPDHTRLRRLASKAFTPRMVEELRPRIQQIADELLDAVMEKGEMDLIADFAYPLPIIVISEMLGIPTADRNLFREWTHTLGNAALMPGREAEVAATFEEFTRYIKSMLADKRKHPGNDVTSKLVEAYDEGDKLNENELLSTIWLLITAGHETTVNLIGNGVLALLNHPDQLRLLQSDPSIIPTAVEELLRYVGPVIITSRVAGEDITMHGQEIRKGDMIVISLGGANLDPNKFANPEALDITREENEHLAFGKGIHLCLGAPLARLEAQIAFATLLGRLPDLHLAIEPEQLNYHLTTLRSLVSLPVKF